MAAAPFWQEALESLASPIKIIPWLLAKGLLTDHLKRAGAFELKLLQDFTLDQDVYRRKILHLIDSGPVIYAEVSVPKDIYNHSPVLPTLGQKPLGQTLLSHDPKMTRSPFQYAAIESDTGLYDRAVGHLGNSQPFYARQSLLSHLDGSVEVVEVFSQNLPTFPSP